MQFTRAEEYGMLGVMYLAQKNSDSITPLSEIAESQEVPEKFLAKIFQSLSRAGIVRSHRGVRGGFTMARKPNDITIKEVLEAIQGPYHLMKCIQDIDMCDKKNGFCALRELLVLAEDRLVSTLDGYSVSDLNRWQKAKRVLS
ncbi:MAG TPA: Rrf2 family transcriptional regulator [Candidatus Deferrimicrobium sp.]|nr:Rrf2 family transcriptional regulator [Candidatus Deferrimicrobium sp.]